MFNDKDNNKISKYSKKKGNYVIDLLEIITCVLVLFVAFQLTYEFVISFNFKIVNVAETYLKSLPRPTAIMNKIINEEGNAYLKYLTHPYWFFDSSWAPYLDKEKEKFYFFYILHDSDFFAYSCESYKKNIIDNYIIYEYAIRDIHNNITHVFYRLTSPDNDVNIFYIATGYLGWGDDVFPTCLKCIGLLDDVNSKPIIIKVDHYPHFIRYPFS